MRVLFAACFSANLLVVMAMISSARGAKSLSLVKGNKTLKHQAKFYADKMMVCNLIQDSHVNEAITKLEAKLEILIALVNKTSGKTHPQPTPGDSIAKLFLIFFYRLKTILLKPVNIWQKCNPFFTAAPVFSCKEQYDKHK